MIGALADSTLRDGKKNKKRAAKVQPADCVQKKGRRQPRKKQNNLEQLTAALEGASLFQQAGGVGQQKGTTSTTSGMYDDLLTLHGKQEGTKRTTRGTSGELPLAFDGSYLKKVGDASNFMNNAEIKTWIMSVARHLKSWYCRCVCNPANAAHLQAAQRDPDQFMIDVSRHQTNPPVASDFVLRTWRFSGHIARDGQRGGAFANSKNSRHMRHAAIMLLVTVIMDLTVNMGYFIRLFLGIEGADLTADDEQILLDLGYASTGTAQPLRHLRDIGAVPRTLRVTAGLFGSVRTTFENLPKSTGCRILVHPPSGPGLERYIVLVGSATQMDEAEEVITDAMETSASLSGMELDLP